MSKVIDISGKLTNEKPKLKLGEGKEFEIDDRKNTILMMNQKLAESNLDDLQQIDEVLEIVLGKEAVKEINKMNLSFSAYQTIFIATMAGAMGEDYDVVDARFQKARETI